jgi:sulfur-oxidizing protein SoxZ
MNTDLGDAKILIPTSIERDRVIYVRALLSHPMHTGRFRDKDGNPIPAYFVTDVIVTYGNEEVARFEWTSGVSRDPFVTFPLKATREAPLRITWKDNRGGVYHETAEIKFG